MLRLKEAREAKGYTQDEIAELLGVSRPAYTRYEQGTRECSFETLSRIADFFDVTTDYLLGRIPQGTVTKDYPDPEVAQLLKDNGIEKLKTARDLTLKEFKMGIELAKTIREEHGYDK